MVFGNTCADCRLHPCVFIMDSECLRFSLLFKGSGIPVLKVMAARKLVCLYGIGNENSTFDFSKVIVHLGVKTPFLTHKKLSYGDGLNYTLQPCNYLILLVIHEQLLVLWCGVARFPSEIYEIIRIWVMIDELFFNGINLRHTCKTHPSV